MNEKRTTDQVVNDIKQLVNNKGYIYALCMILFEESHVNPEKLQDIDYRARLSIKELSLLLGFIIQNEINFSTPDTPQDLIALKQKTYELMEELHNSFMIPFFEKLQESIKNKNNIEDYRKERKEFFGKGNMLTEPIFYSGTGVYDFQYLDFLERKYQYDKDWLLKNKNFDIGKSKNIVIQIKNILEEKSKKVNLYIFKEKLPQIIEELKNKNPDEDWSKQVKEIFPMFELYQYVRLFFDAQTDEKKISMDEIAKKWLESFYKGLIDLFVIRKTDFHEDSGIDSFLKNFSTVPKENFNLQFQGIGCFNWFNAKPIIQLDEERYFIPISFMVFEAVYESPFYWMLEDKNYRDILGRNRGKTGEEITYGFLFNVFGQGKTFKSIKITTKKGEDDTDIDILCILGSKALCVQVKSKKLTELSRTGNDEQLQTDFQGAVQDAYNQGLISRKKILDRSAKFFDEYKKEIKLSEDIDEVYIMGITTENYPSLTHQSHVMLDKKDDEPFPIFSTIFDLELMTYYLNDPYDFLYYIRQRTFLMEYFEADEEMVFLGYHLAQKLWKIPKNDFIALDTTFGQLIDRNYYPLKAGLKVSDEGDIIKNRWKNEDFNRFCNRLKTLDEPKITDIIFHLLDLSAEARRNLVDFMIQTKQKTLKEGNFHNFSLPPNDSDSFRLGFTYISISSDDLEELKKRLLSLCQVRKYKSKGDVWIGFGSLKNSDELFDIVVFNNQQWIYDEKIENLANFMLKGQRINLSTGKKVGRNEKCPCGSNLKYKKCCGKN